MPVISTLQSGIQLNTTGNNTKAGEVTIGDSSGFFPIYSNTTGQLMSGGVFLTVQVGTGVPGSIITLIAGEALKLSVEYNAQGQFRFDLYPTGGTVISSQFYPASSEHSVGVSYDTSSGLTILSIDGNSQTNNSSYSTASINSLSYSTTSSTSLIPGRTVGSSSVGSTSNPATFNGFIGQLAIFSQAPSSSVLNSMTSDPVAANSAFFNTVNNVPVGHIESQTDSFATIASSTSTSVSAPSVLTINATSGIQIGDKVSDATTAFVNPVTVVNLQSPFSYSGSVAASGGGTAGKFTLTSATTPGLQVGDSVLDTTMALSIPATVAAVSADGKSVTLSAGNDVITAGDNLVFWRGTTVTLSQATGTNVTNNDTLVFTHPMNSSIYTSETASSTTLKNPSSAQSVVYAVQTSSSAASTTSSLSVVSSAGIQVGDYIVDTTSPLSNSNDLVTGINGNIITLSVSSGNTINSGDNLIFNHTSQFPATLSANALSATNLLTVTASQLAGIQVGDLLTDSTTPFGNLSVTSSGAGTETSTAAVVAGLTVGEPVSWVNAGVTTTGYIATTAVGGPATFTVIPSPAAGVTSLMLPTYIKAIPAAGGNNVVTLSNNAVINVGDNLIFTHQNYISSTAQASSNGKLVTINGASATGILAGDLVFNNATTPAVYEGAVASSTVSGGNLVLTLTGTDSGGTTIPTINNTNNLSILNPNFYQSNTTVKTATTVANNVNISSVYGVQIGDIVQDTTSSSALSWPTTVASISLAAAPSGNVVFSNGVVASLALNDNLTFTHPLTFSNVSTTVKLSSSVPLTSSVVPVTSAVGILNTALLNPLSPSSPTTFEFVTNSTHPLINPVIVTNVSGGNIGLSAGNDTFTNGDAITFSQVSGNQTTTTTTGTSSTLTLASANGVQVGDVVIDPGKSLFPAYVSAISGTSVTLNTNANSFANGDNLIFLHVNQTTTFTQSGGTTSIITIGNGTGIQIGDIVSDNTGALASPVTVSNIVGTMITLSAPATFSSAGGDSLTFTHQVPVVTGATVSGVNVPPGDTLSTTTTTGLTQLTLSGATSSTAMLNANLAVMNPPSVNNVGGILTASSSTATQTLNTVQGIQIGDVMIGSGIPLADHVVAINPGNNTITLGVVPNSPTTVNQSVTFVPSTLAQGQVLSTLPVTGNIPNSNVFTTASTNGLFVGEPVSWVIGATTTNTTISSILSGTTFTTTATPNANITVTGAANSNTFTTGSTSSLLVGEPIEWVIGGVITYTNVASIVSGTQFTTTASPTVALTSLNLSPTFISLQSPALTVTGTANSNSFTTASTSSLSVGEPISWVINGITTNTTVSAITNSTTFTTTVAPTIALASLNLPPITSGQSILTVSSVAGNIQVGDIVTDTTANANSTIYNDTVLGYNPQNGSLTLSSPLKSGMPTATDALTFTHTTSTTTTGTGVANSSTFTVSNVNGIQVNDIVVDTTNPSNTVFQYGGLVVSAVNINTNTIAVSSPLATATIPAVLPSSFTGDTLSFVHPPNVAPTSAPFVPLPAMAGTTNTTQGYQSAIGSSISVNSISGIQVGDLVFGPGIPAGDTVSSTWIANSTNPTVLLTNNTTVQIPANTSIQFVHPQNANVQLISLSSTASSVSGSTSYRTGDTISITAYQNATTPVTKSYTVAASDIQATPALTMTSIAKNFVTANPIIGAYNVINGPGSTIELVPSSGSPQVLPAATITDINSFGIDENTVSQYYSFINNKTATNTFTGANPVNFASLSDPTGANNPTAASSSYNSGASTTLATLQAHGPFYMELSSYSVNGSTNQATYNIFVDPSSVASGVLNSAGMTIAVPTSQGTIVNVVAGPNGTAAQVNNNTTAGTISYQWTSNIGVTDFSKPIAQLVVNLASPSTYSIAATTTNMTVNSTNFKDPSLNIPMLEANTLNSQVYSLTGHFYQQYNPANGTTMPFGTSSSGSPFISSPTQAPIPTQDFSYTVTSYGSNNLIFSVENQNLVAVTSANPSATVNLDLIGQAMPTTASKMPFSVTIDVPSNASGVNFTPGTGVTLTSNTVTNGHTLTLTGTYSAAAAKGSVATSTPILGVLQATLANEFNGGSQFSMDTVSINGVSGTGQSLYFGMGESNTAGLYSINNIPAGTLTLNAFNNSAAVNPSKITVGNALAVLSIAAGKGIPPGAGQTPGLATNILPSDFIAADFNQDGQVTAADALSILNYIVSVNKASSTPNFVYMPATSDTTNYTYVPVGTGSKTPVNETYTAVVPPVVVPVASDKNSSNASLPNGSNTNVLDIIGVLPGNVVNY